ncbi:alpha/beta fold hydrolase [Mycolicibacterium palauense]|uniref:alpha/beta fold hydrolase n=1 Tax=Mycolicibacterium palauense TaxID=2034511 RepID=UPI000BFEC244|nr:alpha/beta hydrolase [Mycolicibacterium palauense]
MPTVETRAGTLTYGDNGDGPILILLHATLHSHHDFAAVIEPLQREYRVITVDWPGCGRSAPAADPAGLNAALLADALEDLVDHLDVHSVLLIGNSVGGFAAARLAITRPHQVSGLVLVNSGGFIPMTAATRLFCRAMGTPAILKRVIGLFARQYMKPRTALDREILADVRARARTGAGLRQAASLWRSFASPDHDLRPLAAELTAPTLIVWGGRDIAIPLSAGRATHAALPGSRLVVLNTGHVPFSSAPEEFLDVCLPFLRGAVAKSTA